MLRLRICMDGWRAGGKGNLGKGFIYGVVGLGASAVLVL